MNNGLRASADELLLWWLEVAASDTHGFHQFWGNRVPGEVSHSCHCADVSMEAFGTQTLRRVTVHWQLAPILFFNFH